MKRNNDDGDYAFDQVHEDPDSAYNMNKSNCPKCNGNRKDMPCAYPEDCHYNNDIKRFEDDGSLCLYSDYLELKEQLDQSKQEAKSLANALHKRHYSEVTDWELCDTVPGMITQIDNMAAGMSNDLEDYREKYRELLQAVANSMKSEDESSHKFLYYELLMAVHNKWPNETRHETALRYIQQAETSDNKCAQEAE